MFKKTEQFVEDYAKDGLRTLYLAERYLDEDEYYDWNLKSMQAKLEISDREAKVAEIDELIEINLELVGSTAIEDRLQDQVADSIQFMKSAGIKVWVLTGDKIETAMNIGVSAGLLDSDMDNHIIEETEVNSLI
jgi:magnesium-transporting ATPase (P-type)